MYEELKAVREKCLSCKKCGLAESRHNIVFDDGIPNPKLMPIFHPSYLLRNDSREKGSPKWLMWQDIQEIKREYDKL